MLAGFLDEGCGKLLGAYPGFLLVEMSLNLDREVVIVFFGHQALDFIELIWINLDKFIRIDILQVFVVF